MINGVSLLRRKPGISVEEYQRYWRTEHAKVIARLPAIQRYVQSHPLPENYQGGEPVCDGLAEVFAPDSQAFREIGASAVYPDVLADEKNFLDPKFTTLVLTEETLSAGGAAPPDGVKHIQFLRRRSDLPVEDFQRYWRETRGPALARVPGVRRYAQYLTRLSGYGRGRDPAYDGFDVTWFDSVEAQQQAMRSAEYVKVRKEQQGYLAADGCPSLLAREVIVIG